MRKSNEKRVKRLERVKPTDLIVGIDIGSKFHAVVFQDFRGVALNSFDKIYNNRRGFEYLVREIERSLKANKLEVVQIGFEPTGHYWKNIIYYLSKLGYNIRFVRTTAVKSQRELDDSSSSKTDVDDANSIASLVREGKYIDSKIQEGVYRDLRDIGKLRAKVMKMKTSMVCRLRMLMEVYFPEVIDSFWAIDSVGFWRLVKTAPLPEDVLKLGEIGLRKLLSVSGVRKEKLDKQMRAIWDSSQNSIGLEATEFNKYNIRNCIENLEMYHKQLLEIKKSMEKLLERTEYWNLMKSIPGVGVVTAATFLGELGDPKTFNNAKEIIKFAGIDPKENSSGQHKSKLKLSKKGRYLMRTMVYFICLRLIHRSENFKVYYHRKLETKNIRGRSLEKKEAIFAVGVKFIKVLFAMFRDKAEYCSLKKEYSLAA